MQANSMDKDEVMIYLHWKQEQLKFKSIASECICNTINNTLNSQIKGQLM